VLNCLLRYQQLILHYLLIVNLMSKGVIFCPPPSLDENPRNAIINQFTQPAFVASILSTNKYDQIHTKQIKQALKKSGISLYDLFKDPKTASTIFAETSRIIQELLPTANAAEAEKLNQTIELLNRASTIVDNDNNSVSIFNKGLSFSSSQPSEIEVNGPNGEMLKLFLDRKTGKYYRYTSFDRSKKLVFLRPGSEIALKEVSNNYIKDDSERRLAAVGIIGAGSVTAAATCAALTKTMLGDELALTAITVATVMALTSQVYGVTPDEGLALSGIATVAGKLIGIRGVTFLTKWIPGLGEGVNAAASAFHHGIIGLVFMAMHEGQINKFGGTYLHGGAKFLGGVLSALQGALTWDSVKDMDASVGNTAADIGSKSYDSHIPLADYSAWGYISLADSGYKIPPVFQQFIR
jgi:hypothetical protein